MTTETRIAKEIRAAIDDNVMGRGPAVIGQDINCVQQRIVNARVHKGIVQGKTLNSSRWFRLSGWKLNTVSSSCTLIESAEQAERLRRTDAIGEVFTLTEDCKACGAKQGSSFTHRGLPTQCSQCGSPEGDRGGEVTSESVEMALNTENATVSSRAFGAAHLLSRVISHLNAADMAAEAQEFAFLDAMTLCMRTKQEIDMANAYYYAVAMTLPVEVR